MNRPPIMNFGQLIISLFLKMGYQYVLFGQLLGYYYCSKDTKRLREL